MNIFLATIVLFCSSSTLLSPRQIPLHRHSHSQSSSSSSLLSVGGKSNTNTGKAGKGQSNSNVGKAGKGLSNATATAGKAGKGQGNVPAAKAGKGQGNAGGWPSASGNPSGSGRSNAASKTNKEKPITLLEEVRLHEKKYSQQKESLEMIRRLVHDNNVLEKKKKALEKKLNSRPNVPILFHGHYNFGRDDVAVLSRLIAMYLFEKPSGIDGNRIYDCVYSCVTYLEMDDDDNDEYYHEDMRMLLATCLASDSWFSDDQLRSIEQWNAYLVQFRVKMKRDIVTLKEYPTLEMRY